MDTMQCMLIIVYMIITFWGVSEFGDNLWSKVKCGHPIKINAAKTHRET
jgi:hypothetical protein